MVFLSFLNEYDKNSQLMGKKLPNHLHGDYIKVLTRYKDDNYEFCNVKDTMNKLKEYAQVFDALMISFGLRLFPPSAYKDIIGKYKKTKDNIVFLKELRGSKTWSIREDVLEFSNIRIADSGVFIFQAKDILETKVDNFNYFVKELLKKKRLEYVLISYWIFSNNFHKTKKKIKKHRRR